MQTFEVSMLQEQSGLLAAIENTDICTFWYYPKEKTITVHERTAKMYQCRRIYTDMPQSFADDFVHPSTWPAFFEMYRRIDAGEKTAQASFSSIDRKNWCTVTLTTLSYDSQGMPEQTYGIVQNISELKIQEAEHHTNSKYLSSIINALSNIYIFNYFIDLESMEFTEIMGLDYITDILSTEGNAVHAFQQLTERMIDEYYKQDFMVFVELSTLAKRMGKLPNISLEYVSKKQGWCRASFIAVNRDSAGLPTHVEFVVENISAQRKKELEAKEALERAYENANKANASKSAFLNNMSHDIRTPMNAIVGFAGIAAAHINDKERVQDCIAKITASSKHLLSIINEVLDMSRIESGKIHIQEQEAHLPTIMQDFMSMIQGQIHAKGLELFIDTMNLIHENVYADEARLHRILLNLVGNSVKFTPTGGMISIRLLEKPQTSAKYGNFVLSIRDTGIGMSKDFLPHVFEPFERERTATVSKVEGTGLGMAITKNIIEMMGGQISAESEQGKGSTFTIELSLKLMDKAMEDPRIEQLAGFHAMVVDDDYNVCDSVSKMLDKIGMEPYWTMSGKEAVLHAKSASEMGRGFSVYIVDWRLPDMSGVEVVRQLRQIAGNDIPIYILTAYDFSDFEDEAKKAGITAFCQKPLFFSQLRTALLESIGEAHDSQQEPMAERDRQLYGKRILLAEDNELNQEIAIEILTEAGFKVDTADNGKAAVEKIAQAAEGAYDIVLMDIQMPIMDGYEATQRIRSLPSEWTKKLPILAMTANAFEEDRQNALEAGMDGHLAKPIDTVKMLQTLDRILMAGK